MTVNNERDVHGEIIEVDIKDVASERYGSYAKYVITDRAIPDVRDGLKPVQRRIVFAMNRGGNTYDRPYRKSAKSVGDVIGTYHPHGDSSVYEALARMSREWVTDYNLIDMQGNNGSIDGDGPAAMRYTEARLSKIATLLTTGVKQKGLVPMVLNYDDTEEEPVVLPAQIPTILLMGVEGISSGYATSIPTFNLTEVIKALIVMLDKEDITTEELLSLVPAPDFPTGGVLTGIKDIHNTMDTGRGRVTLRGKYKIQKGKGKTKEIIFTEIPYGTNKAKIMGRLGTILESKKVQGLLDVEDASDREGIQIIITVAESADTNVIIGYLLKNASLQENIKFNIVVIDEGAPKQMGVRDILHSFNKFKRELTVRTLEYSLAKINSRLEILDGYIKMVDMLDVIIAEIKESKGRADAKKRLITKHGFSEAQAESIVSMQLHRISNADRKAYELEQKKLLKEKGKIEKILGSKLLLKRYMIKQYEEIIEEYGKDRKTEIKMDYEDWTVRKVDVVQEEDTYVGVSREGYIKRSTRRSFSTTSANGLIEGDDELLVAETTTKHFLLLFTNKLNYIYFPVHEIEDVRWGDTGKHIASMIDMSAGERIVSAIVVDEEDDKDNIILTVKTNGAVKKTLVKDHIVTRYFNTYEAIKQKGEEELHSAYLLDKDKEYFIGLHDTEDKSIKFSTNDVSVTGLKTQGMRGIHVKDDTAQDSLKDVHVEENATKLPKKYLDGIRGRRGKNIPKK